MREVDIYSINDKEYMLLRKITKDNTTYLYFTNPEDEEDMVIRKLDKNDPNYMIPLADEEEVKRAILMLTNSVLEVQNIEE